MADPPIVVGVLNSSDDTVEMLRMYLESEGFVVVSGHIHKIRRGEQTVNETFGEHRPRVMVYDVSPPYDRVWAFYLHLRTMDELKDSRWVLTSTNPARVHQVAPESAKIEVHEIIGKPYDLKEIVDAVKREVEK